MTRSNRRSALAKRLRVTGGLALATSFVLPAVRACDEPILPARELVDRSGLDRPLEIVLLFAMFVAPYLFGAFVALGAAFERRARLYDRGIVALFGVQICAFAFAIVDHALRVPLTWVDAVAVVILALAASLVLRAWNRPGGAVSVRFVGALGCAAWFGGWSLGPTALYGVYVAAIGSVAIAVGAVYEARVRSSDHGRRLVFKLFSGRLE